MEELKKTWNGTNNGTRMALGVIVAIVIILVILLIWRALRNNKRVAAASKSKSASSSDSGSGSWPSPPVKAAAAPPPTPAPATIAQPSLPVKAAQPARVVGSAGFAQKTCGDKVDCDDVKQASQPIAKPQIPVRAQRLPPRVRAVQQPRPVQPPVAQSSQQPQEQSQEPQPTLPVEVAHPPSVKEVLADQEETEAAPLVETRRHEEAPVTKPKATKFSVKNDDE